MLIEITNFNNMEPVQDTVQAPIVDTPIKKKRGRKPNPDKKMYFSEAEEEAVVRYCSMNDVYERDKLFADVLYPAFSKMIESIIRSYTLFTPGEEFDDTCCDAMSFLATKLKHFKPEKGKKAYSYFGTVCKRYLLHKRIKAQEDIEKVVSYDTVYSESHPDPREVSPKSLNESNFTQSIMSNTANEIENMIEDNIRYNLNESDIKVGYALVELLRNWDTIFSTLDSSKKYNKSSVDLFLKETTLLNTKQIRDSKKKYTELYYKLKNKMLSED